MCLCSVAQARWREDYAQVPKSTQEWVQGLRDKKGTGCCATADGYPAEYDWDNDTGHYRVKIEDEWYVVPDDALITEPNKLGYATVWWYPEYIEGKRKAHIRCFIAGAGG